MPIAYQCVGCKATFPHLWRKQRCPGCSRWFNIKQVNVSDDVAGAEDSEPVDGEVADIADVNKHRIEYPRIETGIDGIDEVLCGGLVPGSRVLLVGDPGMGKTTALLQLVQSLASQRVKSMYVSIEMDLQQLSTYTGRLGKFRSGFALTLHERDLDEILYKVEEADPAVVVVDSINMVSCCNRNGDELEPNSSASIKVALEEFGNFAKQKKVTMIFIAHLTKDGAISGPQALNYLVDVSLYFSGIKKRPERQFRCDVKNRFGATPKIAHFKMGESGLVGYLPREEEEEEKESKEVNPSDAPPSSTT